MISEAEADHLHIGFKQAVRALNEDNAAKLFIAADCEDKISVPLRDAAMQKNIPITEIPTMSELGKMCGIDVGASCAVVLKN